MRKYLISAAALIAVAGGTVVIAQAPMAVPGSKDVAKVTGGTYSVEPSPSLLKSSRTFRSRN